MKIREKREKISEKIRVLWLRSSFTRFLVHVSLRTPRSRVALCSLRSLRSPLRGVVIGVRQWTKETCIFYLHFLSYFHFLLYFSLFIICFPQHFGQLFSLLIIHTRRRPARRERDGAGKGAGRWVASRRPVSSRSGMRYGRNSSHCPAVSLRLITFPLHLVSRSAARRVRHEMRERKGEDS